MQLTGPERETERGLLSSGCSLFAQFSVTTVGLEPSEQTRTGCKQTPFRETQQKLYFAMILDLEHQRTPLISENKRFGLFLNARSQPF